uniref:Uncharacterized protein n=1 Tax=Phlebotomus papatasi TaxID=29031 RepID=A0A1B0DI43_PHLPP
MTSVEALIRCQRALKRQLGKLEVNISDGSSKNTTSSGSVFEIVFGNCVSLLLSNLAQSRWNLLQRLSQEFWKRWHNEYVTSLQQRPKWLGNQENLQIGDLVLVKTENFKTGSWSLGRVFNVHPGADDVVRVVTVKTRSGMCRRGVNKLARLPLD